MAGRNLKVISLAAASILTLSACGWLSESPGSGSYDRWESSAAEMPAPPQTRVMQTADGTWLEPDRSAKPVPNATELAEIKQANTRIAELEDEIASLRNDMNMMMPALTKLAGGQPSIALSDIQPAAGGSVAAGEATRIHRNYMQPDSAFGDNPEAGNDMAAQQAPLVAAPPVQPLSPPPVPLQPPVSSNIVPAAAPVPATVQPAAYTPPSLDVTSIQGVRFGNHENGKSRLVIDVSGVRPFKYDIDNNEHILVVEIPGTVWNAGPVTKLIQDNPLIQSMSSSPDGQGGTRIVFQLQAPAKILWSQAIPPSGQQGHRIVLDIAGF